MTGDAAYTALLSGAGFREEGASLLIGKTGIGIRTTGGRGEELDYSRIRDMRLINYRMILSLSGGERLEIARLGLDTERFFENLWLAYDARSREALFVQGEPGWESECDYTYREDGEERRGRAKLALYPRCLCILPHDDGARRIPLCFATDPELGGFHARLTLDTGECYTVARLGRDTQPFYRKLARLLAECRAQWQQGHADLAREISRRLGERLPCYEVFCSRGAVVCGLFAPGEEGFWFAAVKEGRAAVELVIGENTATYLYRYDAPDAVFTGALRHAMEAVGAHREILYLEEGELESRPLYVMGVQRSAHIRFLRRCYAGRVIHTPRWEEQITAFFQKEGRR